jgi:DNA polymerase-3 subunit epsilon
MGFEARRNFFTEAMNWFSRLFVPDRLALTAAQAAALAAWKALPEPPVRDTLEATRWVVVDVESSGLDLRRDRLISIGAVSVHGVALPMADSFEVVLRQEQVSRTDNILVHGIGGTAQREGVSAADGLLRFLAYAGNSPVAAFHAAFDTIMIGRALREHLGLKWTPSVIDLADLMPALFPRVANCRHLDDWLAHFGIDHYARHQALSDAYSTAQLLQVALPMARAQGLDTVAALRRLQQDQRALSRFQSAR